MDRQPRSSSPAPTASPEALAAYQAAIDLWLFSSGQAWERFNIMLAANAILIAAITLSSDSAMVVFFRLALPWLGIASCLLWFLLVKRSFDYAEYYTHSAREIEEQHLSHVSTTVSRGGPFSKGQEVVITIGGQRTHRRLSWPGRLVRARTAAYFTIGFFFLVYVAAALPR